MACKARLASTGLWAKPLPQHLFPRERFPRRGLPWFLCPSVLIRHRPIRFLPALLPAIPSTGVLADGRLRALITVSILTTNQVVLPRFSPWRPAQLSGSIPNRDRRRRLRSGQPVPRPWLPRTVLPRLFRLRSDRDGTRWVIHLPLL